MAHLGGAKRSARREIAKCHIPSPVTVSFSDSNANAEDTAASASSSRRALAKLCPRRACVTIYSPNHCGRCREDSLRELDQVSAMCEVYRKCEVRGDYPMCFPYCYRKREAEKMNSCKCGKKIRPD